MAVKVKVIERHLESKTGDPSGGEDRLVEGPEYYAVIDGATDHTGNDWGNGRTGGQALADIVSDTLSSPAAPLDPSELMEKINARINEAANVARIDLSEVKNRADVTFAAFVPKRNAVYHIHDCTFAFVKRDGAFEVHSHEKLVDGLTSELRACVLCFLWQNGIDAISGDDDMGRDFIWPILRAQPELQNIDADDQERWFGIPKGRLAYRTLNGMPTTISETPVPAGVSEIVLASDGFKDIRPTLKESIDLLKLQQRLDPCCIGPLKGTKRVKGNTFDDTSFLRIGLNAQSE